MLYSLNIAIVVFFFCFNFSILTKTVYISPTGDDSSTTGSESSPYKTFGKALSMMNSGDVCFVREGRYHEIVIISKERITFQNYPNENPIIDGEDNLPTGGLPDIKWRYLLRLNSDYSKIDGIGVENSRGGGVSIDSNYAILRNMKVKNIGQNGIVFDGDANHGVVDGCDVSFHNMLHDPVTGRTTNGPWGAGKNKKIIIDINNKGISTSIATNTNITVKNWYKVNNFYYSNNQGHGEGIDLIRRTSDSIAEDNICYDNFAVQIYCDLSRGSIVRRNLVYGTRNPPFYRHSNSVGGGIVLCNEAPEPGYGLNHKIYDNFIVDTVLGLTSWPSNNQHLEDIFIYHNIVIEPYRIDGNQKALSTSLGTNINIFDNMFVMTEGTGIADCLSTNNLHDNLWSRLPSDVDARGANDMIGNPKPFIYDDQIGEFNSITPGSLKFHHLHLINHPEKELFLI